jgi:hypothetical protein
MFCSSLRAIQVVCILGAVLFVKIGRASAQDSSHAVASDPHAVQPERPTVATHAHTVAPGWLEIEAGIERDKLDTSISFPTPILFKLGLTDRMQLGFFIPHITWHNKLDIGDFGLNLKWRLLDDAPLLGDFALLPSVKFPTSYSSNGGQGTFDASLVAISSHDLNGISMDVNVGYTVRTDDGSFAPKSSSFWTASFGGTAYDKLGWEVECFGMPGTKGFAGQAPIVAVLLGPNFTYQRWITFDAGCILKAIGPQPFGLYAGLTWNAGKIAE